MVSMVFDGFNDNEIMLNDDVQFGLCQLNLQIKGLISGDLNVVIWGGKCYYQCYDLYIIDIKYWNIFGFGVGVENYIFGLGVVLLVWICGDVNDVDYCVDGDSNVNINYIDLCYVGWKLWMGLWIEFGIDYVMLNIIKKQDSYGGLYDVDNGVMLIGEISQDMLGGYNKIVLQYVNKGLVQNMVFQGGGWYDMWNYVNDVIGYCVINIGLILIIEKFFINYVLIWGLVDDIIDYIDKMWMLLLVVCGQYQFIDYVCLIGEVGGFYQKDSYNNGISYKQVGEKYIIVLGLVDGLDFMLCLELCIFVLYLNDFEDGKLFEDQMVNNIWNFGVQVEVWW